MGRPGVRRCGCGREQSAGRLWPADHLKDNHHSLKGGAGGAGMSSFLTPPLSDHGEGPGAGPGAVPHSGPLLPSTTPAEDLPYNLKPQVKTMML